jgi:hypothetical protein
MNLKTNPTHNTLTHQLMRRTNAQREPLNRTGTGSY